MPDHPRASRRYTPPASSNGSAAPPPTIGTALTLPDGTKVTRPPAIEFGMPAGSVNAYTCPECEGTTVTIHVHAGTTPMLLACRADGTETHECEGMAHSAGYPPNPPPHIVEAVAWEWYRPDDDEWSALPDHAREYCDNAGLLLRRLTHEVRG